MQQIDVNCLYLDINIINVDFELYLELQSLDLDSDRVVDLGLELDDLELNCVWVLIMVIKCINGMHDITSLVHMQQALCAISVQVKVVVPNATIGMVIGKGGCYIKQIKDDTGAYVQISQKSPDAVLVERVVTIAGWLQFSLSELPVIEIHY